MDSLYTVKMTPCGLTARMAPGPLMPLRSSEPSSTPASSTSRPVLPQTGGYASTTPPSCFACRRCRTRLCALDASTMVRHGWDDTSALAER